MQNIYFNHLFLPIPQPSILCHTFLYLYICTLQCKRPSAFIIFLCCLRPYEKIHFCKLQDRVGGGGGGFFMHVHFIPFCLGHYVVERPTSKSPTGIKPVTTARQCSYTFNSYERSTLNSRVLLNIIH